MDNPLSHQKQKATGKPAACSLDGTLMPSHMPQTQTHTSPFPTTEYGRPRDPLSFSPSKTPQKNVAETATTAGPFAWDVRQKAPTASPTVSPPIKQPAWTSKQHNLFQNAPAADAPPAFLLEKLSLANPTQGEAFSRYDPDGPGFNASIYIVKFTGKFKCPHQGCTYVTYVTYFAYLPHILTRFTGRALVLAKLSSNT